jgi:hypothetical protein
MVTKLDFKDLTYGCNVMDREELRIYKVVGFDSKRGSIDVVHHLNKATGSINNYRGISLSNEILNAMDIEHCASNCFHHLDDDVYLHYSEEFKYLHELQRLYLATTNKILEYKPI